MLLQRSAHSATQSLRPQLYPAGLVVSSRCRNNVGITHRAPALLSQPRSTLAPTASYDQWDEDDNRTAEGKAKYPPRYDESVEDEGADWDPAAVDGAPEDDVQEVLPPPTPRVSAASKKSTQVAPTGRTGRSGLGPQAAALASFEDRGDREDSTVAKKMGATAASRPVARGTGPQSAALASFCADDAEDSGDSVMNQRVSRASQGKTPPMAATRQASPPTGRPPTFEDDDADVYGENEAADKSFDDDDAFDWREKLTEGAVAKNRTTAAEMDESFDEEEYNLFLQALARQPNADLNAPELKKFIRDTKK